MPPRVVLMSSVKVTPSTSTMNSSLSSTQIFESHSANLFSKAWRSLRNTNIRTSSAVTNRMTLTAATGSHRG